MPEAKGQKIDMGKDVLLSKSIAVLAFSVY
jgi:hypothetical protein